MAISAMLALGISLVIVSVFYISSFLALLGTAISFWAVILLYITPAKHVPLTLLNASTNANSGNIERLLAELDLTEKGVYLPPKNLKNIESSLIFIPQKAKTPLPTPEETTEKLYSKQKNGVLITPPGLALSQLFEQEYGSSFTKAGLKHLQSTLPKLLVENLELSENAEMGFEGNTITVEILGSVFNSVCHETDNQPRTHVQVGCLLSSALACIFAKTTGKPITIQNETQTLENKTTTIEYRIEEE
jgi:hypothetical protein